MFSMNLSAPVVARAEADAGAYTVGQAAHDPGLIKLLRHRLVELAWFPDDDVVNRFNVGGTKECADQDRRLQHVSAAVQLWSPVAACHLCLCAISVVWAPVPHVCALSYFQLPVPPPLAHLQCHSSPSGSYHPRCHPPHLLVGPPHHSRLQISGLPRGNRGTECGRPVYSGGPAHVRHLCLMCATCCALSSLWDH